MIQPGPYAVDRDQAALSAEEAHAVDRFHQIYYDRWLAEGDTLNLSWFGYHVVKTPMDLWMYQELLIRTRPDVIVETGTYLGGSALFLASILDLLGHGHVISIDLYTRPGLPSHPRIEFLEGSSVDSAIVSTVHERVAGRRAMVLLDSDHAADHVLAELAAYSSLVQPGDYLVVEDTNINGHPARPSFGPGPMEAVDRFLAEHSDFEIDPRCERFLLTMNPRGYLRRR